ncbi:hypothetical protein Purlil1_7956 [Purpureocillium lilacinum]|uniref:Ankyrin repeats (3 copies) domain-containing protein n=2 Tax=Purpureocillium lilacinum TaxID=33203 RepID=A0ABR0BUD8_PURLI|nr:hypothetical protein Purlil1_7956 [Purpureocillium lilacinum]
MSVTACTFTSMDATPAIPVSVRHAPRELASLPAELLLLIAGFVPSGQDLSALSRTNRRLYGSLLRYRYRQGVRTHGTSLVTWAIRRRRTGTVRDAVAAGGVAATTCPHPACAVPSPLELAAQYNFEELVALLLGARDGGDAGDGDGDGGRGGRGQGEGESEGDGGGINVNARSAKGQAALCWAAAHRNAELARMLLRVQGIDLETRDPYGRTPLAIAAGHGDAALVEVLLAHGADANSPLLPAPAGDGGDGGDDASAGVVVDAAIEAVVSRLLKDRGAVDAAARLMRENAPGRYYDSCSVPLLLAVGSGHGAIARVLVAHGAHLHLGMEMEMGGGGGRRGDDGCRCSDMYA